MSVTDYPGYSTCLSGDTKPAKPDGWLLKETDTGNNFTRINGAWVAWPAFASGGGGGAAWGGITGTLSSQTDLSSALDGKAASTHAHAPADVTGTAVITTDSRLSDARVPTTHDSTKHSVSYEPANANIQAHVVSAHAPSNAQKNSDILIAEIEAKLTGVISSHSHSGGGGDPYLAKLRLAGDITNATTTPAILTGMSFAYLANSFYIFDMYMMCTSAAVGTGYGFCVDVNTAVTYVGLQFVHQLANTGTLSGGNSKADNTATGVSSGVPAITVTNFVMGRGILVTGANTGTAQFMFRPEVAASATCKAGSVITVMKIA